MNQPKRSLAEILAEKKAKEQAERQAANDRKEQLEFEKERTLTIEPEPKETIISNPSAPMNPTTPTSPILKERLTLAQILAKKKQTNQPEARSANPEFTKSFRFKSERDLIIEQAEKKVFPIPSTSIDSNEENSVGKETFSLNISLNREQELAKEMAFAGKSFCLIGAAGTGKTTAQREIAKALLNSGQLTTHTFRAQGTGERVVAPSIGFVAYTRIASGNLRRAIHKDPDLASALTHNVTTLHNLLEYTPEEYWDYEKNKESFRFVPKRTAANPLDITHLVVEESSMVGLDLWQQMIDALRPGVQIIFIGDINQLPPVFGDAILNYGLVQLPVVELTHVYRQAGDSTILTNAHKLLKGESLVDAPDFRLVPCGTENHGQEKLSIGLGKMFNKWAELGEYNPNEDIILCPWNKRALGTDNMNKWIAQPEGTKRNAVVFEVIAGINKVYLAAGDKIMYNKMVGIITEIIPNTKYMGRKPLPASSSLTRFGSYTGAAGKEFEEDIDYSHLDLDKMMEEITDRVLATSHTVKILLDNDEEIELSEVGKFAPSVFSLAYCLTVHKAQGCEWRKVYIILHRDHKVSLSRELLYTAITRAREAVVLLAKPDIVDYSIKTQRIKGNTLAEKIEYFNSGINLNNAVRCTK